MLARRMMMTLAILIAVPTQADEAPDVEMLEYLGNWETAKGVFVDPMELEAEDVQPETKESPLQGNRKINDNV